MRMACGLLCDPPDKIQSFAPYDPVQEARAERRRVRDALASVSIIRNVEVNMPNLHELWNLTPSGADVGKNPRMEHITQEFERMVKDGLWMRHGKSYHNQPCFSPVIRPRRSASLLFGNEEPENELKYMEKINVKALRLYAESEPRRKNAETIKQHYTSIANNLTRKRVGAIRIA